MAKAGALNTSDILGGIGAGLSAYSSMVSAETKAEQAEFRANQKAKDLEVQQKAQRVQAQQKQKQLNERLQQVLAQQRAIQSASGVAIGSGSPATDRQQAQQEASEAKQRVADNLALQEIETEEQADLTEISGESRANIIESRGIQNALQGISSFGFQTVEELEDRKETRDEQGNVGPPEDLQNNDDQPSLRGNFGFDPGEGLT